MRASTRLLIALFFVFRTASSALASESVHPGPATLSGRVQDSDVRQLILNGGPPPISDGWSIREDPDDLVVPLAEDGSFEVALDLAGPRFFRLTADGQAIEVFLTPGAASRIVVDADGRSEFEGDHRIENRYLADLERRIEVSRRDSNRTVREVFTLAPDAFDVQMAAQEEPFLKAHATLVAENPGLAEAVQERTWGDIHAFFGWVRLIYPTLYLDLTGERAPVGETYYEEIGRDRLRRVDWLSSRRFVAFLDRYVDLVSAGELRFDDRNLPREKLHSRYETIRDLDAPAPIRDHLLAEMFETFRTNYGPADWGSLLERLERDQPGHAVAAAVRPQLEDDLAEREAPDAIRIFREVDGVELEAHVFYPEDHGAKGEHSAYLFFHGGGWAIGTPEWGYASCRRMADRGLVAISFEYRLADVHGSPIFDGVADTRAAIAWARERAAELKIDPTKVIAAGFSAGGHLAGTAAILDIDDGLGQQARPDAIILHSSSYDTTKSSFFDAMTGGRAEAISLQHQARPDLVPALLLHGEDDHLAPLAEFQSFVARMNELENDFEHHLFEGVGHFFRNGAARRSVIEVTDEFLVRRGFLESTGD